MKIKDIKNMNHEELKKHLDDSQRELFNLRFQLATGKLSNPNEIKKTRKTIAMLKTVIRERELSAG